MSWCHKIKNDNAHLGDTQVKSWFTDGWSPLAYHPNLYQVRQYLDRVIVQLLTFEIPH